MEPTGRFHASSDPMPIVRFAPLAWLKLQFLCHAGPNEVGGFARSADDDLLHIEDMVTVRQDVTPLSVRFHDPAVADYVDQCVDQGLPLERVARIWVHTHPGDCPLPSAIDERTFARSFGDCTWAIMLIVARTGATYSRLAFGVGPRAQLRLPVQVDWTDWPRLCQSLDWKEVFGSWQREFKESKAIVRTLRGRMFDARLKQKIREAVRGFPALKQVRVTVSR